MQTTLFDAPPTKAARSTKVPVPQERSNWIAVASAEHARRGRDECPGSSGGFVPYRRDVQYTKAIETPIAPLLNDFSSLKTACAGAPSSALDCLKSVTTTCT